MKKNNPFKRIYYDLISKIEIKYGGTMTKGARIGFLVSLIALIVGFAGLVVILVIQPMIGYILGLSHVEPLVSVQMMQNNSLNSVNVYEDNVDNYDEVYINYYNKNDTVYYIVSFDDNKEYKRISAYGGIDGQGLNELELKHLSGNQYFLEFIKNKEERVRYRIELEENDGSIYMYTFAYDSK